MATVTTQTITGHLDAVSWTYATVADGVIISGFRCRIPYYDYGVLLEIRVTRHWVSLRAYPQRQIPWTQRRAILHLVSTINASCHQVRAFVVEDCVVFQLDLPVVQCHRSLFLEGLGTVCRYASDWALELTMLATDPSVASLYEDVDRQLAERSPSSAAAPDDQSLQFDISANRLRD